MKFQNIVLLLLIVPFLIISSCKKEEDNNVNGNEVSVNGESFNLEKGHIISFGGNDDGSFDFDVYLFSSGISFSDEEDNLVGLGDWLYLDLNTSSPNGLVSGTYTYSVEGGALTFLEGSILAINVDLDGNANMGTFYQIAGGTVDISVEDDETSFDFNLVDSDNNTIAGQFSGVLSF